MLYPNFKDKLLSGKGDMITSDVYATLTSSNYNYSNVNITDIIIDSTSEKLTNTTSIGGAYSADDVNILVTGKNVIKAIVLHRLDGTLIAYINNITGIPFDNTNNTHSTLKIIWNTLEDKILRI